MNECVHQILSDVMVWLFSLFLFSTYVGYIWDSEPWMSQYHSCIIWISSFTIESF